MKLVILSLKFSGGLLNILIKDIFTILINGMLIYLIDPALNLLCSLRLSVLY
jgi:hypothetical protein